MNADYGNVFLSVEETELLLKCIGVVREMIDDKQEMFDTIENKLEQNLSNWGKY